jgi:tRNA/tmRNA/rRNA uracil-C5-methylase (TrmA/RlmC/RlmD family)
MTATHDELELRIEKPAAGGRMIARHEGQVILVSGAIPGERVRARVDRADKSVAYASTIDVLEPSADRREVRNDWTCGGNVYAFIAYPRQLQLKSEIIADAFARIGRMPLDRTVPVMGSREDGYRMRARLQVQSGRVGFFREGTHDLCEAGTTGQLLPDTALVLDQLSHRLRKIDPDGVLAVELSENMAASERTLHLQLRPAPRVRTTVFAPVGGVPGVSGATCQLAAGAPAVRLGGQPTVGDTFGDLLGDAVAPAHAEGRLERQARAFFQGNRYLLPSLMARVLAQVPATGTVIDLYAGVGLFGLSLAATGRGDVTLVEGDRVAGTDLTGNARRFVDAVRVELRPVEHFLGSGGTAEDVASTFRSKGGNAETILVDPPRTGLSRAALQGVLARGAGRLVYVSCDIATLARDVRQAVDRGYAIAHMEAFDLFPNTAHVETLAVLERD